MSYMKIYDPALYKSHSDAIHYFIKLGHLDYYDFNVCSKEAANRALGYLCINNIPHSYHTVSAVGLCCVTISWSEQDGDHAYCFWCEGEI